MTTGQKITWQQMRDLSNRFGYEKELIQTIINVETPGFGFSPKTGKILIQFEPGWFKRTYSDWQANKGTWYLNGISDQAKEWEAFNNAFAFSPAAAMMSTSIGMMQVMGLHYVTTGFKSVGAMWDFAKVGEANHVELGLRFIKSNASLDKALKEKDWYHVAYYYNGAGFRDLAKKNNSVPYDRQLQLNYFRIISSR